MTIRQLFDYPESAFRIAFNKYKNDRFDAIFHGSKEYRLEKMNLILDKLSKENRIYLEEYCRSNSTIQIIVDKHNKSSSYIRNRIMFSLYAIISYSYYNTIEPATNDKNTTILDLLNQGIITDRMYHGLSREYEIFLDALNCIYERDSLNMSFYKNLYNHKNNKLVKDIMYNGYGDPNIIFIKFLLSTKVNNKPMMENVANVGKLGVKKLKKLVDYDNLNKLEYMIK